MRRIIPNVIHPARIKNGKKIKRKEMDATILVIRKTSKPEVGSHYVHPDLIKNVSRYFRNYVKF